MKMSGVDKFLTAEEEKYNFEIQCSMLVVDKLPEVTDRIFCEQICNNLEQYLHERKE